MTFPRLLSVLLPCAALLLAGCGKSVDQKRQETELNDANMKVHETQMAKFSRGEELEQELGAVIARHDSLFAARPDASATHPTDDLRQAQNKLRAAREGMQSWMSGFKAYNPDMPHDEAMSQLKKDSEALTKAGADLDAAIVQADSALALHARTDAALAAPAPKGRRK